MFTANFLAPTHFFFGQSKPMICVICNNDNPNHPYIGLAAQISTGVSMFATRKEARDVCEQYIRENSRIGNYVPCLDSIQVHPA